ncbi:MAG: hypothetical protein H7835_12495 [Magnetococcus sp. XQGC-1]
MQYLGRVQHVAISVLQRSFFLVLLLLFGISLLPGRGVAGSPDWGTGFYRLNPSKEPAFSSEQYRDREEERRRTDRNLRPPTEPPPRNQTEPPPRSDLRRGAPEWPDRREPFDNRSRYDVRPWGEVPPEWRNDELDRRVFRDRDGSGTLRRPPRYYDGPEEVPWSALPEADLRGNPWEYPYAPDYRRRDAYPAPYYYYDDRYGGARNYRRRLPPYYYDGGDGWWDAP